MKPLAALLTAISLLAGCGDEDTTGAPPERPDGDGPLVVFTRGGGFAPQPYRLEVDREGGATLTTTMYVPERGEQDRTRRFTLTADDRATLTDALAEAEGSDDGPGTSPACADCFIYGVKADGIDFALDSVTYTDDATPVEQVTLVAILEQLAERG